MGFNNVCFRITHAGFAKNACGLCCSYNVGFDNVSLRMTDAGFAKDACGLCLSCNVGFKQCGFSYSNVCFETPNSGFEKPNSVFIKNRIRVCIIWVSKVIKSDNAGFNNIMCVLNTIMRVLEMCISILNAYGF